LSNALTNRFDNPSGFVANHNREIPTPFAPDMMDIAMTDPCGTKTDFHFAWPRRIKANLLNNQRLAKLVADSGFHDG
jgi:hypothetical protein